MKVLTYRRSLLAAAAVLLAVGLWAAVERSRHQDSSAVETVPDNSSNAEVFGLQASTPGAFDQELNMELADESETMLLYVDRETAEVAVKDKRSKQIWRSNPQEAAADAIASPDHKERLRSQFTLTYYNSKNQAIQYNSYTGSAKNKQFIIAVTDDGLTVEYTMGDLSKGIDIFPKRMSKKRFEAVILDKIDNESDRSYVSKRYRLFKKEQLYVRYDGDFSPIVKKKMSRIFAEIGYDEQQLQIDNEANVIDKKKEETRVRFKVTVQYQLEGDSLVVKVPLERIAYPQEFPIHTLSLLEFFGAADSLAKGYMFVPDGSGAIIRLNNGKQNYDPIKLPIYGDDRTREVKESVQINEIARLPLFGMKQEQDAYLAVIEQGDAAATIEADVSGRLNTYNYVYPRFELRARDELSLRGADRVSTVSLFHSAATVGAITVRYSFLNGDEADYSGMAKRYRSMLWNQTGVKKQTRAAESMPFYLELIGAVEKRKTFLGIPYRSLVPLTTFSQAEQIVSELLDKSVKQIKLRYTGWFNGGVHHSIASKTAPDDVLGGSADFAKLAEYLEQADVELYPDAAFQNVYQKAGGFSPRKDAARLLNKKPAQKYPFDKATFLEDKEQQPYWLLSPAKLERTMDAFLNSYKKLGIDGLALRDLGDQLFADYARAAPIDRQQAMLTVRDQYRNLAEQVSSLLAVGGNAYVLPYTEHLLHVPQQNSGFYLTDESVPFYQMVIHGYIAYAGEPFNAAADQSGSMNKLKSIETGSAVYYQWFYGAQTNVMQTDYTDYYAMQYSNWLTEAAAIYSEVDGVLGHAAGALMIRHEQLQPGVYRTEYDNGYYTIVNYNTQPVMINGQQIAAEDYAAGGGEQQ